jgi:hypothetical protein
MGKERGRFIHNQTMAHENNLDELRLELAELNAAAQRRAANGELQAGFELLNQALVSYQERSEPWAPQAVTLVARLVGRYRERYAAGMAEQGWRRVGKRWGHLQLAVAPGAQLPPYFTSLRTGVSGEQDASPQVASMGEG